MSLRTYSTGWQIGNEKCVLNLGMGSIAFVTIRAKYCLTNRLQILAASPKSGIYGGIRDWLREHGF